MNDIRKTVAALRELVEELKNASTVFERAALFSAIRALTDDIRETDDEEVNGYAREKAYKVRWHSAAALGFDIDNGHPAESHRCWALGELSTLESVTEQR
ncbi:hypothetical protein D3C85_1267510 [compost metagenome]